MIKDTLRNDLDKYLQFRIGLGCTDLGHVKLRLGFFVDFCTENYGTEEYLTKEMIDSWFASIHFKKSKTQVNTVGFMRGFTRFLNSMGIPAYIPDKDYSIRSPKFIPLIYTDDELTRIFEAIDSLESNRYYPSKNIILPVIFRMIYCCGLRPGEPLRLKVDEVNLKTGDIYIRKSKNERDRHIIMSEELRDLCCKYNDLAGERIYFFQGQNGKPVQGQWINKQLKLAVSRTGIIFRQPPRVYDFRHNFATRNMMRWMDQKKDIFALLPVLSEYMGHKTINHTLYYVHLMPERLLKSAGIDWEKLNSLYKD